MTAHCSLCGSPLHRSLAELRKARGLNQAEVAKALGIQQPAYAKIEKGWPSVPAKHVSALARLFRVDAARITGHQEATRPPPIAAPAPAKPAPATSKARPSRLYSRHQANGGSADEHFLKGLAALRDRK